MHDRLTGVWKNVVAGCALVKGKCKPVMNLFAMMNRFCLPLLIAVVVGLLCGFGTHLAGSWLSVFVSGVGGVTTTLAVQVLLVFRSLMLSISDMAPNPGTTQNDAVPST